MRTLNDLLFICALNIVLLIDIKCLSQQDGETFKLFVPHRHVNEFEEASLIQSVNGGDWEPCDPLDETPTSIDVNKN